MRTRSMGGNGFAGGNLLLVLVDNLDVSVDDFAIGLLGFLRLGSGGTGGLGGSVGLSTTGGGGLSGLSLLVELGADLLEVLQGGLHLGRIVGLEFLLGVG